MEPTKNLGNRFRLSEEARSTYDKEEEVFVRSWEFVAGATYEEEEEVFRL